MSSLLKNIHHLKVKSQISPHKDRSTRICLQLYIHTKAHTLELYSFVLKIFSIGAEEVPLFRESLLSP